MQIYKIDKHAKRRAPHYMHEPSRRADGKRAYASEREDLMAFQSDDGGLCLVQTADDTVEYWTVLSKHDIPALIEGLVRHKLIAPQSPPQGASAATPTPPSPEQASGGAGTPSEGVSAFAGAMGTNPVRPRPASSSGLLPVMPLPDHTRRE